MESFDNLFSFIDFIDGYAGAINDATEKFLQFLPIKVEDEIGLLAQKRLHNTVTDYMSAISIDVKSDIMVVSIPEDKWLAVHLETGADEWPMVLTHMRKNFKVSKDGFKYKVIPIKSSKAAPQASTEKAKNYFQMIKQVLQRPKFAPGKMRTRADGSIDIAEKVIHNNPLIQGLYRLKSYNNAQDYMLKKTSHTRYVVFRTMSEKRPDKFVHPGIAPANIFPDAQAKLNSYIKDVFDMMLKGEVDKLKFD